MATKFGSSSIRGSQRLLLLGCPFLLLCSLIQPSFGYAQSGASPVASGQALESNAATQRPAIPLPPGATAQAFAGNPYGVARVVIPVAAHEATQRLVPVRIVNPQSRSLYPAAREVTEIARTGPPLVDIPPGRGIGRGRLLGRLTNIMRTVTSEEFDQVVAHEILFLFRGAAPLSVVIETEDRYQLDLVPVSTAGTNLTPALPASDFSKAVENWWDVYTDAAKLAIESGDYPPVVESYLVATLARRLQLPVPDYLRISPDDEEQTIASTLALVVGTEALKNKIFTRVATGDANLLAPADRPLPPAPQWQERAISVGASQEQVAADPASGNAVAQDSIEPLAHHVPPDAFYLRFGSFTNYLWFRELGNQFGGDITRMITIRGFDYEANKKAETLLHLRSSELADTFGPAVIEDIALIGHDLFLTEGPSIGVLLQARNAFLLQTALQGERRSLANTDASVSLKTLEIDGHEVSFLSSADNRVRSFMVSDGNFFLVTSSRLLVQEFLACSKGMPSLADLTAFREARMKMPNRDDYKIFAYCSEPFLQNLVSPKYQIELRRRLFSSANITMVHLAQLAASNEKYSGDQLDNLIGNGWLPPAHGKQPDGSGLILAGDVITDSKRGAQGSFLPIADVRMDSVTAEEFAWYAKRAQFYSEEWSEMDPLVIGVRTVPSEADGNERILVHAEIAPLVPEKYGWILQQLGPPTRTAIDFAPDDIAAIQAHVVSDRLGGTIPPHHLFLAVKDDLLPNPQELDGLLSKFRALQSLSAYLGAWPQPGLIDRLPLGLGQGPAVGPGMTRLLGGLYRYQGNAFSIVSFLPEIITNTLPYLGVIERDEPAQVRLHVDNLKGTQLEAWINQQLYDRTLSSSIAGARLLDSLTTQLGVAEEDARSTVNKILDAKLQCSMGGDYLLAQFPEGSRWWSTAVSPQATTTDLPVGFTAPILQWFRGAQGRITKYESRLVVDLEVDVAR